MNVNDFDDKIFYKPGDLVELKQDLPNKPKMIVVRIERSLIKKENPSLRGLRCRWFTADGHLQEAVFSTKDLIKL